MKRYLIVIDGRTFEVELLSDPGHSQVEVRVDGEDMTVYVDSGAPPTTEKPVSPSAASRSLVGRVAPKDTKLFSPLPGLVTSVAVQPGQQVVRGQVLLNIEAMKMDNLVKSARAGTVAAVHVTEGRQVAHGDLLLEWEQDRQSG